MKNEGLKQLRELALADNRMRHPNLPEQARCTRTYNDRTANGLALCISDFLRFKGHQIERISVTGRYIDQSKAVKDTLGFTRKIGSGKWIKSSMQPGSADLAATIKNKDGIGVSVKIEIKIKSDRQSELQKQYQKGVEQAGGKYWLVKSFDEFLNYYNELI